MGLVVLYNGQDIRQLHTMDAAFDDNMYCFAMLDDALIIKKKAFIFPTKIKIISVAVVRTTWFVLSRALFLRKDTCL